MNQKLAAPLTIASLLLAFPAALLAQTAAPQALQPAKHRMLSGLVTRLHAAHPGMTPGRGAAGNTGQIIGDKRSHVYHMPGSPGTLPAMQNRVYFATAAQAQAAGYRMAGSARPHGSMNQRHTAHPAPNNRPGMATGGAGGVNQAHTAHPAPIGH